jgi:hypothetical protein
LEAALEVVVIQKQLLLDQWAREATLTAPLEGQADFEVVDSEVVSMGEEEEVDSAEAFKIEEAMVAVEEEVLAIKAVEASHPEADTVAEAEIGVGMGVQTDTEHPLQTLPLALEVHVVVASVEVVMVALDPRIATALACLHQLVGMTRVEAGAHMMTGPVDIVAATAEDMEIVMGPLVVEAVATWSR